MTLILTSETDINLIDIITTAQRKFYHHEEYPYCNHEESARSIKSVTTHVTIWNQNFRWNYIFMMIPVQNTKLEHFSSLNSCFYLFFFLSIKLKFSRAKKRTCTFGFRSILVGPWWEIPDFCSYAQHILALQHYTYALHIVFPVHNLISVPIRLAFA